MLHATCHHAPHTCLHTLPAMLQAGEGGGWPRSAPAAAGPGPPDMQRERWRLPAPHAHLRWGRLWLRTRRRIGGNSRHLFQRAPWLYLQVSSTTEHRHWPLALPLMGPLLPSPPPQDLLSCVLRLERRHRPLSLPPTGTYFIVCCSQNLLACVLRLERRHRQLALPLPACKPVGELAWWPRGYPRGQPSSGKPGWGAEGGQGGGTAKLR